MRRVYKIEEGIVTGFDHARHAGEDDGIGPLFEKYAQIRVERVAVPRHRFAAVEPADQHAFPCRAEYGRCDDDAVPVAPGLHVVAAGRLGDRGIDEAFDEVLPTRIPELLREGRADQIVAAGAQDRSRRLVQVLDAPVADGDEHDRVLNRPQQKPVPRVELTPRLVVLFKGHLRLDELLLRLGHRPQVAAQHEQHVGIVEAVEGVADRKVQGPVVGVVDLDGLDRNFALAKRLEHRVDFGNAFHGQEFPDGTSLPVAEIAEALRGRIGQYGQDGRV